MIFGFSFWMPSHRENGKRGLVKWKTRRMTGDAEGGEQDYRKLSALESLLSYSSPSSPNNRSRCVCEHVWSFGVRHCSPLQWCYPRLNSRPRILWCSAQATVFSELFHTHTFTCLHMSCQFVWNSPDSLSLIFRSQLNHRRAVTHSTELIP